MDTKANNTWQRNKTADFLKGIAVLLMIQVHIMELFAKQEILDGTFGKVSLFLGGPPAAPVFMAVMGYFIFYSGKSFNQNLIRALKLFFGGILLNIGLNLNLLLSIYHGKFELNPWHYVFGADILPLAGLSIAGLAFIKRFFRTGPLPYLLLLVIFSFISTRLPDITDNSDSIKAYIQAFFWGQYKWSYFPFLSWFIYPLAGYTFALVRTLYEDNLKAVNIRPVIIISTLFLIFTFKYAADITHNLQIYYHHDEVFVGWVLIFLGVWTLLNHFTLKLTDGNMFSKYIQWLGKNVTAAYVIQWLIVGNIATEIFKTQNVLNITLWFAAITAAVSLFVLMYEKMIRKIQSNKSVN